MLNNQSDIHNMHITPLRYWCQKILPLVYDDSISYYELLCKVVTYLNKVINTVNEIPDYIDNEIAERLTDEHIKELIRELNTLLENTITPNNEGNNTNASQTWDMGTWLWHNDILYVATKEIPQGVTFIFDGENINLRPITLEEMNNITYYPNDMKISVRGLVSDYSEIVTRGDYHVYKPQIETIQIIEVE